MSENLPNTPSQPETPPAGQPPQRPVLPQQPVQPPPQSGGCGKIVLFSFLALFLLGILGVCTLVGTVFLLYVATDAFGEISGEKRDKQVTERIIAGNDKADNKIAVMHIEGIITSDLDGFIARQIRRVTADSNVKAVVLRIESPGGTMAGSDYYLYLLKQMKADREIPIVVSMGSVATSGGYYVAMIGDEIYAEPSTITGSIGVIASLFDASELFNKIGIESTPVISGDLKAMGSFMRPMSEEERIIWQRLIDENFNRFKEVVFEGRQAVLNRNDVARLATGQIYTAGEALNNKLIDRLGFLEDAVDHAARLTNLQQHEYKVIQYRPKLSFMDALLESRMPGIGMRLTDKTLSEMTTPQVYALCPYVVP